MKIQKIPLTTRKGNLNGSHVLSYWNAIREIKTNSAQHCLQRYGIPRNVIWNTFTLSIAKLRFHLIGIARIYDGDIMRKYVYHTVLYSGAFDSFSKQGWSQIDKGVEDLESGIERTEKDGRCTGALLNLVTNAT